MGSEVASVALTKFLATRASRCGIISTAIIQAFEVFRRNPRPEEFYNLEGVFENSVSILEVFDIVKSLTGKKMN
jgi:hypothetical protein